MEVKSLWRILLTRKIWKKRKFTDLKLYPVKEKETFTSKLKKRSLKKKENRKNNQDPFIIKPIIIGETSS